MAQKRTFPALAALFLVALQAFALASLSYGEDAQVVFADPHVVMPEPYCNSLALGDLDGDGDLDVAVVRNMSGDYVALNDGSANFTEMPRLGVYGEHRDDVALGDMDLDGDLDFFYTGPNLYSSSWYVNDGFGNFSPGSGLTYGGGGVAVGDLTGDSFPEVVQPGWVNINDTVGGFVPVQSIPHANELAVALGDADNDGDLDVAVGITLWLNDGSGVLSDTGQDLGLGYYRAWGRTFADVNNDGWLDLLMANSSLGAGGSFVLLNDGHGVFNWTGERLAGAYSMAVADLDLDGNLDVVLSGTYVEEPVKVYLGDGSGLFGEAVQTIPVSEWAHGGHYDVALGDLNGDGLADLVLSAASNDCTTAYMNVLSRGLVAEVDIKPGSDPNSINLGAEGVVPVAILTTPDFDAASVDEFSLTLSGSAVRLKGKSDRAGSLEDVDGDGDLDLVVQFSMNQLVMQEGATEAVLEGFTLDGTPITGKDSVRIVK